MRHLLTLSFLTLVLTANARQITPEEAQIAAQDFFNNSVAVQSHNTRTASIRVVNGTPSEEPAPYYIFNASDNNGFVIISGDDRTKKILGYSDHGSFDTDNIPPQLSALLDQFSLNLTNLPAAAGTDASWSAASSSSDPGVLLETANWGQGYPYNMQCPIIEGVQCPTGCVATAMAIVMKYHNWPESYNWNAMPNAPITSSNDELAKLMADIGLSVDMVYGANESSTDAESVRYSLVNDYSYSNSIQFVQPKYLETQILSSEDRFLALKSNLDRGLPCIISGESNSTGHMFIVDGYIGDQLHINWGWDGVENGYFSSDLIKWNKNEVLFLDIEKTNDKWAKVFIDSSFEYSGREGVGLNVRNKYIVAKEPIEFVVASFSAPLDFEGEVTLALTNQEGQIIELINSNDSWASSYIINQDERDRFAITNKHHRFYWDSKYHEFYFTKSATPGDKISVVAKEAGENEWKPVPGTITALNSVDAVNNIAKTAVLKYNEIDGVRFLTTPVLPDDKTVLIGQYIAIGAHSSIGIPELDLNGYQTFYICPASGIEPTTKEYYAEAKINVFGVDEMPVTVYMIPFSEMKTVKIELKENEAVTSKIETSECRSISDLTITGHLTIEDYCWVISNIRNLMKLDIENTDLDHITTTPIWIDELKLPHNLKHIQSYSFISNFPKLTYIVLPDGLELIHVNAFTGSCGTLNSIISKNEIPPLCEKDAFCEFCDREGIGTVRPILFVPTGSSEKYKNAVGWSEFHLIVETDMENLSLQEINYDGYKYFVIGEHARVMQYPCDTENLSFPQINLNNKFVSPLSIEFPLESRYEYEQSISIKNITIPGSIQTIGWGTLSSLPLLESLTINEGVKYIEYDACTDNHKLYKLEIPQSIMYIGSEAFGSNNSLRQIYYNATVPIEFDRDIFTRNGLTDVYDEATLYVTAEALPKIKTTMPWCLFNNIRVYDPASIERIESDGNGIDYSLSYGIFNLQGIQLSGDISSIPAGIYIIRQGRKVQKIVVK